MYLPKSEKELELIREIMDHPDRDWTLSQISEETDISKTTVWRAVNRLEEKNYIEKKKKGKTSLVKVKNKEVLQRILERSFPELDVMENAAKEFCRELKEIGCVKKCFLFGSVARGTADLNSDIDILIILDSDLIDQKQIEKEEIEEEITLISSKVGDEKSVNLMPDMIESRRFGKMKKHGDPFAETVLEEGKVLYDKDKEALKNE